ncbi:MAG TPA: hypothetical protein VHX86_20570 [Tepidisphaeraceae bacterium]|jgi:antitoxin (DNA-binding transcriptional repressor) of toxin-antitoxin stability system|nr:hypothetical protein [Tepidisphaeraceae bacterium]
MRIISLTEAQRNLASLIREIRERDESVEIVDAERANAPMAILTPHRDDADGDGVSQSRAKGLANIRRLRAEVAGKMNSQEIHDAIDEGRL